MQELPKLLDTDVSRNQLPDGYWPALLKSCVACAKLELREAAKKAKPAKREVGDLVERVATWADGSPRGRRLASCAEPLLRHVVETLGDAVVDCCA